MNDYPMIQMLEEHGTHYATATNGVRFFYLTGAVWTVYPLLTNNKPMPPVSETNLGSVRMFLQINLEDVQVNETKRKEAIDEHIKFLKNEISMFSRK